jgi:murein L,D-transpeptidase YcbB/YkuD
MSLFGFRNSARARLLACAAACVVSLGVAAPLAGCDGLGSNGAASVSAPLKSAEQDAMLKVLADAPTHGFSPDRFSTKGIEADLGSRDRARRAAADKKLVDLTLAYARAQHGLGVPKGLKDANWGLPENGYDPVPEFIAARRDGKMADWLAALPPPQPGYAALRAAYLPYLKVWQAGGWTMVPEGPPLKAGSRDPRVAQLRARLAAEDPALSGQDPAAPFDAALAQAVQRFQARVGITPSGVVDKPTLAALNVTAAARAAQIRANLERWRWVPRDQPATRIEVNSAAGLFDYYRDGQPALHMLAASGKPGDETPILASTIKTVVINPTWNVPDSIAKDELYPKEAANPGYFAAHNFTTEDGRLVQQPGDDNALGVVKFLFDNKYSVYLHDTPAKAAFSRDQRSVSHGCVRLEHAVDLAKTLLSDKDGWSAQRVDEALASQQTQTVSLAKGVPVEIYYWTAFTGPEGVSFRDDIYGWDAEVLKALDSPAYATETATPKAGKTKT